MNKIPKRLIIRIVKPDDYGFIGKQHIWTR